MAFYAAAYVAIVLLLRARLRPFTPSLWLDGLIGLLTLGAFSVALVLPQDRVGEASPPRLVYPCADLVLLALVLWAGSITGWRGGRTWLWLSGAFAVAAGRRHRPARAAARPAASTSTAS